MPALLAVFSALMLLVALATGDRTVLRIILFSAAVTLLLGV